MRSRLCFVTISLSFTPDRGAWALSAFGLLTCDFLIIWFMVGIFSRTSLNWDFWWLTELLSFQMSRALVLGDIVRPKLLVFLLHGNNNPPLYTICCLLGFTQCNECCRNYRQARVAQLEKSKLVHTGYLCNKWRWLIWRTWLAFKSVKESEIV